MIVTLFCPQLYAQEAAFEVPSGGLLTIEGEDFTFEQLSVIEGEEFVLQERAIWEGGVTARFTDEDQEMVLQTGHIEAIFDGADVSRLVAGPEVVVTALGGRALFECADVEIDFPVPEGGEEAYSGTCNDVHGYYLADAEELGLEGDEQYEVNFTASAVLLGPDAVVLERPCLSLGDLENPDVAVRSRNIACVIGSHPVSGERTVLGARVDNLSLEVFGHRLNVIPFRFWRGFVARREPGLRTQLPRIGWEGDEYLRIDQTAYYDFAWESVEEGPRVIFRLDSFPFGRSYPEIIGDVGFEGLVAAVRMGYRREEDRNGDPVPTRAEPEFSLRLREVPLEDTGLEFSASTFWGHMRDMQNGPDLDRWGYRAVLDHPGVSMGDFRLSSTLEFTEYFYEGDHHYRILDGRVRLRYVDPPNWGASLTYRRVYDWGLTPFRFEIPQVVEELGLREQTRLNRRWGAGFDWAWDFGEDEFERQECHLTYILDSFQVSLGWDFADETVRARIDLPGSLK